MNESQWAVGYCPKLHPELENILFHCQDFLSSNSDVGLGLFNPGVNWPVVVTYFRVQDV